MQAMVKKTILSTILWVGLVSTQAQDFGISASFFIPKNGYFSAPISPLSIRGVSLVQVGVISIETGGSLYRMTGMGVTEVPINTRKPMVGPFFSAMVPLEAVITLGNNNTMLLFKGGGFAFYNFGTKLNYGNLDRAIADYAHLEVANSDFTFTNSIGYGYEFGVEYIQYVTRQFGVTVGANYYIGGSKLNLRGSVKGVDTNGQQQETNIDWPNAKLDYTGFEISLGLLFSSGRR